MSLSLIDNLKGKPQVNNQSARSKDKSESSNSKMESPGVESGHVRSAQRTSIPGQRQRSSRKSDKSSSSRGGDVLNLAHTEYQDDIHMFSMEKIKKIQRDQQNLIRGQNLQNQQIEELTKEQESELSKYTKNEKVVVNKIHGVESSNSGSTQKIKNPDHRASSSQKLNDHYKHQSSLKENKKKSMFFSDEENKSNTNENLTAQISKANNLLSGHSLEDTGGEKP